MADAVGIIQLVATILGMSSIIVGVFFSLLALRNNNKARNMSLFMQYQSRTADNQFLTNLNEINSQWKWSTTEEFFEKYGPENDPALFSKFISVGSYFDSMGMMLKTKNIDIEYIPEIILSTIIVFWKKVEPFIDEMSVAFMREESFSNIKYLYDAVIKHDLILMQD